MFNFKKKASEITTKLILKTVKKETVQNIIIKLIKQVFKSNMTWLKNYIKKTLLSLAKFK